MTTAGAARPEPGTDGRPATRRRPGRPELFDANDIEPIMPAQWFAGAGRAAAMQAEKRLMFAVLRDAVEIVMQTRCPQSARGRMLREESAQWIASDDRAWPYSFVNLCEALGIEPGRLRSGLARFDRDPRTPAPDAGAMVDATSPPRLARATG